MQRAPDVGKPAAQGPTVSTAQALRSPFVSTLDDSSVDFVSCGTAGGLLRPATTTVNSYLIAASVGNVERPLAQC
jgi:hypothetical protein